MARRARSTPVGGIPALEGARALVVGFSIALGAGCAVPPTEETASHRLDTLGRAFAVRFADPEMAADLFAEAGKGTTLERARLAAWSESLRRCNADSNRWRSFLEARPTGRLEARTVLSLARALADEGDSPEAVRVLVLAPDAIRHQADLELLDLGDTATAAAAAKRLALEAPHLLRGHSRSIEKAVLATFDHDDWMTRAAAWRRAGLGSRGASELRGRRASGDEEKQRRQELARCELDAGSTGRALNALPAFDRSDPEELVLRAEAYRRRGWGRIPDRSAMRSFGSCLEAAQRAAPEAVDEVRGRALALILECGTESGSLEPALDAWRALEASSWSHRRRTWLGRRLGVALARSGSDVREIDGLATAIPNHERCLRYWLSASSPSGADPADLTSVAITDLYGRWAQSRFRGDHDPVRYSRPDSVGKADPPASVAWLLEHAGPAEASDEWQRQLARRHPTRSEALAAASLANDAGRFNTSIRTLRKAFPHLSSTRIAQAPADAAVAYLPLRWSDEIKDAAAETGLDPWLIAAVARQESTFNALARSPAGARGVLQLLPSTARLHARKLGLGSRPNLEDPAINIRLGAHELAWLLGRFKAIEPALAAYNAGERRVRGWWRRWPEPEVFTESIPIPETYTYVRRVVFLSDAYRQIHAETWEAGP